MNNSKILLSLKKRLNGNHKYCSRFNIEFNSIFNESKEYKLLRERYELINTYVSYDLDSSLDVNVKMKNLYYLNTKVYSYLKLNFNSPKYIMLIDKFVDKDYVDGNLFYSWNILIEKYDPKSSVTENKLIYI